jgi:integrase
MCSDAVSSKLDELRVRDDDPSDGVKGLDRGSKKGKQFLYPSELLRVVSCEDVPTLWRVIIALSAYLYLRPGELRQLDWEDVDLEHGTVHVHQATDRNTGEAKATKTDSARRFSIEANLLPLLRAMHEASGGAGKVIALPCDRDLARGFSLWLTKAKVDRAELHTNTPTRKAITVYDLRATGITWCAIRGDDPLKIMQRAGHARFETTQGYIRAAEMIREGFGDVFPPLPLDAETVQELSKGSATGPNYSILLRRGRDSNPRRSFSPAPA